MVGIEKESPDQESPDLCSCLFTMTTFNVKMLPVDPSSYNLIIMDRFVLFWDGWPSQWLLCDMVIDDVQYNCCEQWMMAEKARVFKDDYSLYAILASKTPREQKALGRKVRGFDPALWDSVCRGIVYAGNLAKFSQNSALQRVLLATGDRIIVEASPVDPIWGIGLHQDDLRAQDPAQWRGTNWLGVAIMQVRETLKRQSQNLPPLLDPELQNQLDNRKNL